MNETPVVDLTLNQNQQMHLKNFLYVQTVQKHSLTKCHDRAGICSREKQTEANKKNLWETINSKLKPDTDWSSKSDGGKWENPPESDGLGCLVEEWSDFFQSSLKRVLVII